jgi:peptidyl-prolyl cis-trans isomerase SurA
MYRLSKISILALCVLVVFMVSSAVGQQLLDGIAATVDDRIILVSEVESQLELLAMESNIDLSNKAVSDSLKRQILKQMIDDKLILIEAEKDTTISVTSKEIEDALNQHIERIKSQFPSEQVFLTQLSAEGLTLRELRTRYRDEVKNQLYKERYLNKRLGKISISSGEVKEFYSDFADSLPKRPAGVHLAHILITSSPSQATKDSLYAFAEVILGKVKAGEDFALLAKNYSDDATGANGGDLGWFNKGDMVPAFEAAAFALEPGQVSDIVETQYGYHIIKVTEKKGNRVRASHILFMFQPTEEDIQKSKVLADSVYQALEQGASFDTLAAEYSDDQSTAPEGGDLGWYASDELSSEFKDAIAGLEPGQFSEPALSRYGYHILKLIDKKSSRPLDFKEDYADIEAIAKRYKAQVDLENWLNEIREKYYIEVKI